MSRYLQGLIAGASLEAKTYQILVSGKELLKFTTILSR